MTTRALPLLSAASMDCTLPRFKSLWRLSGLISVFGKSNTKRGGSVNTKPLGVFTGLLNFKRTSVLLSLFVCACISCN